jgi:precorrin-6A/cobalt-precorrin-6A reductase
MPAQPHILVFGGTVEGRELVEWLAARASCLVTSCTATPYGASLVADGPQVTSSCEPLPPARIAQLMDETPFVCVVDATHPYATHISESIREVAQSRGVPVLRLVREGATSGPWHEVDGPEQAAAYVEGREGAVLLTTGSKDLPVFVHGVTAASERLYVRVLPVLASLEKTAALGIPARHVIAMQGPFSKELNVALIREFGIQTLVTKASGAAGGFWEKIEAAQECGCEAVVIRRPVEESGLSAQQVREQLAARFGV